MPHLTIEYSTNVARHHNIDNLVDVVHQAAIEHGLASVDALRTRAAERSHFKVADGRPGFAFIAITARIGPGRSEESKESFLDFVLDRAEEHTRDEVARAGNPNSLAIAWSIEVTELNPRFRVNRNHVRRRMKDEAGETPGNPNREETT
jgi:5-carboxymethyl-2-hydroxymuconate isomerase